VTPQESDFFAIGGLLIFGDAGHWEFLLTLQVLPSFTNLD